MICIGFVYFLLIEFINIPQWDRLIKIAAFEGPYVLLIQCIALQNLFNLFTNDLCCR